VGEGHGLVQRHALAAHRQRHQLATRLDEREHLTDEEMLVDDDVEASRADDDGEGSGARAPGARGRLAHRLLPSWRHSKSVRAYPDAYHAAGHAAGHRPADE